MKIITKVVALIFSLCIVFFFFHSSLSVKIEDEKNFYLISEGKFQSKKIFSVIRNLNLKVKGKIHRWNIIEASEGDIRKLKMLGYRVYKLGYKKIFLEESVPLIGANKVWKVVVNGTNITGKEVSVCVVDTGVDYTHPDLGGCYGNGTNFSCKVIAGYNFVNDNSDPMDDHGHGTHVAGIVAANGTLKGVAPDAKIVAVKVCDALGRCPDEYVLNGIEWCINHSSEYNIGVISMSLGGGMYSTYCDEDEWPYAELINEAVSKNISVVVATGNEGYYTGVASPACVYNATRVGATYKRNYAGNVSWCLDQACSRKCTDSDPKIDNITCFTNRGKNFDVILMAPGVNINSTFLGGYEKLSGTSMATPHVSGAIALLKQANASLEPKEIEDILNDTGKVIYDSASERNYSRINIYDALKSVISPPVVSNFSVSPFYGNLTTNFTFSLNYTHGANISPVYVRVYIDGEGHEMSSEDANYTDGAIFNFSTNLSYGIHNFSFEVFDGLHVFASSTFSGPWVADAFWTENVTEISGFANLSGNYILSNASLVNITGTLILSNSYVQALNATEFAVYGNFTLRSSNVTAPVNISSYGNLFLSDFSPLSVAGYAGKVEIHNSSLNLIHVETNSTIRNVNASLVRIVISSDSVLKNFHREGIVVSKNANLSIENVTASVFQMYVINSTISISNSTLNILCLNNSFAEVNSSHFDSVEIIGNSSVKGYLSLGNLTVFPNSTLNRYFPVKLVKDISGTPAERNVSTWKDSIMHNFSTVNGFAWVNETFVTGEEEYLLWIENYGFARINGTNVTLFALKNVTQNITVDVVYPFAKNISVSHRFISPNASLGKNDNTTISFSESEKLMKKCIIVKGNLTLNVTCNASTYTWDGRDGEGNAVEEGNYSIWLNLTDSFGNTNLTNVANITVDNTEPVIEINVTPPVVIKDNPVNVSVAVRERYVNISILNISSSNENLSLEFKNSLFLQVIPNYTGNYTVGVVSLDLAGNSGNGTELVISREELEMNITCETPSPINISVIYENFIVNETSVSNQTVLKLPEWVFDIKIHLNKSLEILLKNVNVSLSENSSVKIDTPLVKDYLKTYAVNISMNFTCAKVRINYSDCAYTNEDYLAVYRCDGWNFSKNACESGWVKINASINKTLKIFSFETEHFSAFAIKQEPYCGDGKINQEWEECDGNDFGGKTCKDYGFDYGSLVCTAECEVSTSLCKNYYPSSSSSSSHSSSSFSGSGAPGKKEEKIINITLSCPERVESVEGNVTISIRVKNSGNQNFSSQVSLENVSMPVFLTPSEEKILNFTFHLFPGVYEMRGRSLNSSCTILVIVNKSRARIEIEGEIAEIENLILSLNVSAGEKERVLNPLSAARSALSRGEFEKSREYIATIRQLLEGIRREKIEKKEVEEREEKEVESRPGLFLPLLFLSLMISILTFMQRKRLASLWKKYRIRRKLRKLEPEVEKLGDESLKTRLELAKYYFDNEMYLLAKIHLNDVEKKLKKLVK